jgi:hypothetical protein
LWLALPLFLFSAGCGSKDKSHRELVGAWQMQPWRGVYMTLAFHNNGTFEVDERIEGNLSRIVEKRGKASGKWQMDAAGSRLTLTTSTGNRQIGWPAGKVAYSVAVLNRSNLRLVDPGGKHQAWARIRSSREESSGQGKAQLCIAPIVVNLAPSRVSTFHPYKWICTEVDMTLDHYKQTMQLPARVREKIIFFLNSKTYEEMNTGDKLSAAARQLKDALNPYMDNRIVTLAFSHTILTERKQVMEDFVARFSAPKKGAAKK